MHSQRVRRPRRRCPEPADPIAGFAPYRKRGLAVRLRSMAQHPSKYPLEAVTSLRCPRCDSRFVQPGRIDQYGTERWRLELRCPECDWTGSRICTTDEIEVLEEDLDRGYDELVASLAELVRSNMADYVDRFRSALAQNAIQPMDF